jgi:hypothetical protein
MLRYSSFVSAGERSVDKMFLLKHLSFGSRVAEDEIDDLQGYFVETDQWNRLYNGNVDVIYGPKGSGKSALYFLLLSRENSLFDRNILIIPAENPRGTPVFEDIVPDPPTTEFQFIGLWKLYLLSLAADRLRELGLHNQHINLVATTLEQSGLIKRVKNLKAYLREAFEYVRSWTRLEAIEGIVATDPTSGMPIGFSGKVTLREPTSSQRSLGYLSIDALLGELNSALAQENYTVWLTLDRLDVAFSENHDIEVNALRGLFKVYLDLMAHERIKLKIFLRSDIWRRITKTGFREASHITRTAHIKWTDQSLLNLAVRRIIQREAILKWINVKPTEVLSSIDAQGDVFERIFPEQVDVGAKKPATFDWLLSRTSDGFGASAPRELIHLLNASRDMQVRKLELGEAGPADTTLISSAAIKDALPEVSRVRLEQTLYAEYPDARDRLERLRGQKTEHTVASLAAIWGCDEERSRRLADELIEIGFFLNRGSKESPSYWVPFIYRDGLEMVQGKAE